MPFSTGLSSTTFFFAGSSGAKRRGRTGCVMVLIDRVALKLVKELFTDDLHKLLKTLVCRETTLLMVVKCAFLGSGSDLSRTCPMFGTLGSLVMT
jgi:hypothetical protein